MTDATPQPVPAEDPAALAGVASVAQVDEAVHVSALVPPWYHGPLAVLDTETTGLAPEKGDRVIEIAVVHFDGGVVVDRWSTLLDPGIPLHPDVTRITGITTQDITGQPRFAEVAHELLRRLKGRLLVAYNAAFDRNFLVHELARVQLTLPQGSRWIDPLVFAREMQKGQGNHKLGSVAKRLGVSLEEAHRAAADAECAGHVLLKLAVGLPQDLAGAWEFHEKWEAVQEAERAGWRSRQARGVTTLVVEHEGPRNTLGPSYPLADETDPVRYMFLRAAGRA